MIENTIAEKRKKQAVKQDSYNRRTQLMTWDQPTESMTLKNGLGKPTILTQWPRPCLLGGGKHL